VWIVGIGFGLVTPVDRRVGEGLAEAERNVGPAIEIVTPSFQQHDTGGGVFGEPRGHHAAGRPGAHDDKIGFDDVLLPGHAVSPDADRSVAPW
jgi:hypothetical protein